MEDDNKKSKLPFPWVGAFFGAFIGAIVGILLLPDVDGGVFFSVLVFGFAGFESCWAWEEMNKFPNKPRKRVPKDKSNIPFTALQIRPNNPVLWFAPISAILLCLLPYSEFYEGMLKVVICTSSIILAYNLKSHRPSRFYFYSFIFVALLLNPLIQIPLHLYIKHPLYVILIYIFTEHYLLINKRKINKDKTSAPDNSSQNN
jgi:hypothetical protein